MARLVTLEETVLPEYKHLGVFSDWVSEAYRQRELYPLAEPGPETQQKVRECLGFTQFPEIPQDLRLERSWKRNGLQGEEISWSVGFGPRTRAWFLKPAGVSSPLPGILALHDHGGYKFYGKEKIADGPGRALRAVQKFRQGAYGGRAYANVLAREGFAVLIHDTFLWGSRKFPWEELPEDIRQYGLEHKNWGKGLGLPRQVAVYNAAAGMHEHLVEKYCNLLGTTLAGVVSHEDRIALAYLSSRPDVDSTHLGCVGLSGGGNRAALLTATSDLLSAAVIVGLMSTYPGLLDHNVLSHTWMLFPQGWSKYGDWPDLAACRAPRPLLVQYDLGDDLFTWQGMRNAHERLQNLYETAGMPQNYTGQFYPGPHKFDLCMQAAAFNWLKERLG